MLNTVYRLIAPKRFEVFFQQIDLLSNEILVKPDYLSICHADQRYYQGLRKPEILKQKLPMALIHEGIGKVVYDPNGKWEIGQRVVMIPNQPVSTDHIVAENYLPDSVFCSSGYDGFMRDYINLKEDRIIKIPDHVPNETGAFIELVSVAYHAVNRLEKFSHTRRKRIGIWGDGNLGFIVALIIKTLYPERELAVIGVNQEKLSNFTFADYTFYSNELPQNFCIDHAMECVGGIYSEKAINQIINHINPEGSISILGVSEMNVPVNTRKILEKGLRLFGSSRSGKEDFLGVISLMKEHKIVCEYLETLITHVVEVESQNSMIDAFDIDYRKNMGKTILHWQI